ncbi:MAG: exodeoxyribonuclease VII small subunit [Fretibacterium sp.]|nr:exodeoxyribonuclease VII small subunit [Fretibacterium sp.]
MSFDENLERLDGILKRLESEPMPLDAALGVFEEGIGLVRESETLLKEAEQKVSFLAGEEGEDDLEFEEIEEEDKEGNKSEY